MAVTKKRTPKAQKGTKRSAPKFKILAGLIQQKKLTERLNSGNSLRKMIYIVLITLILILVVKQMPASNQPMHFSVLSGRSIIVVVHRMFSVAHEALNYEPFNLMTRTYQDVAVSSNKFGPKLVTIIQRAMDSIYL